MSTTTDGNGTSSMRRIYLEIKTESDRCSGSIYGLGESPVELDDLALGPGAQVKVKGQPHSLGKIWDVLVRFDHDVDSLFDERGQRDIGRYLFEQTLGSAKLPELLRRSLRKGDPGEIRVVSSDPEILRLPWILLTDESHILAQEKWSITLAGSREAVPCAPEARPKILVVAPDDLEGWEPTGGGDHFARLEQMLAGEISSDYAATCLRRVRTLSELTQSINEFLPHFVYFFGHGYGDEHSCALLLESRDGRQSEELPIVDFASILRNAPGGPPSLVYLNCCRGDSSGFLGAGMLLRDRVPAVIANRTAIEAPIADGLGIGFWKALLLYAIPPDCALVPSYSMLPELFGREGVRAKPGERASFADPGWMTPVLHVSYDTWTLPALRSGSREQSPFAVELFDRNEQIESVTKAVSAMFQGIAPPFRIFVWAGAEGQGADGFHDHLLAELKGNRAVVGHVVERRFEWPAAMFDPKATTSPDLLSMKQAIAKALPTTHLNETQIEHAIHRDDPQWDKNANIVFYFRLPAVQIPRRPVALPRPLDWPRKMLHIWSAMVATRFRPPRFGIVGLPLITESPEIALDLLEELKGLGDGAHAAAFASLPELESVSVGQILKHLEAHYRAVLPGLRQAVAQEVWQRAGAGRYEEVLRQLPCAEDLSFEINLDSGARNVG